MMRMRKKSRILLERCSLVELQFQSVIFGIHKGFFCDDTSEALSPSHLMTSLISLHTVTPYFSSDLSSLLILK